MKKVAVITGGSRGIGAAIVKNFAKNGYKVVFNYKNNKQRAEKIVDEVAQEGGEATCYYADLSVFTEAIEFVSKVQKLHGEIDVLINNVGISSFKLFSHISEKDWIEIINTNLMSAIACTQVALKDFINKKSGRIINISSIWGITGASCEVHYSTTKAAIIGFTKSLAKELAPSNITVNCIAPGVIDTEMNMTLSTEEIQLLKEEIPLGRLGTAQEVAACALFLASNDASYITGQILSPNGGIVI